MDEGVGVELSERIKTTLMDLPSSPLLDRATVVDAFLDLLIATADPDERRRLERSLAELPRSVVVDRMTATDALLDVLATGPRTEKDDFIGRSPGQSTAMGAFFLAGYITMVGVAIFLLKYAMKDLSAYQLNVLMGIGMLVTGVPALWLAEGTLALPRRALPLGGSDPGVALLSFKS